MDQVAALLEGAHLAQHSAAFEAAGYDDLPFLKECDESILRACLLEAEGGLRLPEEDFQALLSALHSTQVAPPAWWADGMDNMMAEVLFLADPGKRAPPLPSEYDDALAFGSTACALRFPGISRAQLLQAAPFIDSQLEEGGSIRTHWLALKRKVVHVSDTPRVRREPNLALAGRVWVDGDEGIYTNDDGQVWTAQLDAAERGRGADVAVEVKAEVESDSEEGAVVDPVDPNSKSPVREPRNTMRRKAKRATEGRAPRNRRRKVEEVTTAAAQGAEALPVMLAPAASPTAADLAMRSELLKYKTLYEDGLISARLLEEKRRQIIGLT